MTDTNTGAPPVGAPSPGVTTMDEGVHTFQLATMGRRGLVVFSPEGMDLLRAWLIRHIEECARSEGRAKSNPNPTNPEWSKSQATYYKNARAFLTHMLCSRVTQRVNLAAELGVLTRWHDEYTVPPGWAEAVQLAAQMEQPNATGRPVTGGGGAGGGGGERSEGVAGGLNGEMAAPTADGGRPAGDLRPRRAPTRKANDRKRARPVDPDH